jgi:ATP-dependent DNA helicase RecG
MSVIVRTPYHVRVTVVTPAIDSDIEDVPGVSPHQAEAFRRLGLCTAGDLLCHMPLRYEHEHAEQSLAEIESTLPKGSSADANVAVRGQLAKLRFARARKPRVEAVLEDGTGSVKLTWFNANWMRGRLHPGQDLRVWGRAKRHKGDLSMVNPRWDLVNAETPPPAREERHRPVYPASEGLPSEVIERAIDATLDPILAALEDHLHEAFRDETALPTLADAYRMVHRPEDDAEAREGRRRLAFDELFLLELGVMLKRLHRRRTLRAIPLTHNDAIDSHIRERFPFTLTDAQNEVIAEIAKDLTSEVPMNRLLQGDVGAGKTVVAMYAMLMAVAAGHQAAMMAPTELLADQHFASISAMLGPDSRVRVELLSGSLKPAERNVIIDALAAGEIDILLGTHALLTDAVTFKSLAVAVIDEQHRFGVHQRATIRAKTAERTSCPHGLVMTATPIPRTLSLTIFGDLDVSTIRELPPGRKPVITRHVSEADRSKVYDYVAGRIDVGDQVYIVVPAIDESTTGLTDAESHLAYLRDGPLAGRALEILHGRLPREEREQIMQRFRAGEVMALVATTVIEVGVDVPQANIMVIEHADRFGLAQLHQLRGRVGRGGDQGLCTAIADPVTADGRARLDAFTSTTDGFLIAEKDLEIRGPGELFGARQAGMAPFRVARLPADFELLRLARRHAIAWAEESPTLAAPRDALLKRRLLDAHGAALGLGDVG